MTFRELDFWLAKGFGGILNILYERVTKVAHGFSSLPRKLLAQETRRMAELNDAVQSYPEEIIVDTQTSLVSIDNWFIKAYGGLDRFLTTRIEDGPPINENNLLCLEEHIIRLQEIIRKERSRCTSTG